MRRPDDCSLTPGQLAIIKREAERALREAGALGVFPTPVDRIMTVATLRPDGWPQATTAGYVNEGLTLYFLCGLDIQKAKTLARDKADFAND